MAPEVAFNFVTIVALKSVTQMLEPSYAIPLGPAPAGKVPRTAPEGDSFVTLLLRKFAVQILVPSKQMPVGALPTGKDNIWVTNDSSRNVTKAESEYGRGYGHRSRHKRRQDLQSA